jgi:hypothetical protein
VKRCRLDKIASVTLRLRLDRDAVLSAEIPAREGTVVAARVLNSKTSYNVLEDVHGRMVALHPGDLIAGALGKRDALYGYSGYVPDSVAVGDELALLNLGGVIGAGAEAAPGIGEPFRLEILGSVLEFPYVGTRGGRPADVARAALRPAVPQERIEGLPPAIALVGTCMDAGKTTAAAVLIRELVHRGVDVAAGKLTGVSLRRDVLAMHDCGADPVAVFTDFGVVTTDRDNAVGAAHALLAELAESEPDLLVLEMGDGLLGTYGVDALLADPLVSGALDALVLCAQDPVGAWGGREILRERYRLGVDLVCGRVTDTPVGRRFCERTLEIPSANALRDGTRLAEVVLEKLGPKLPARVAGAAR